MPNMLYTIALVLLALWAVGLFLNVVGSIVHLLLVIAAILVVYKLIAGRRGTP
jgi:hypothetical protein